MAKPFGPLLELADRWRPIFADPNRDYFYLTELRSARRARNGARLEVAADDGSILHFALTFVQPEVLRVQLFADTPPPPRRYPRPELAARLQVDSSGGLSSSVAAWRS